MAEESVIRAPTKEGLTAFLGFMPGDEIEQGQAETIELALKAAEDWFKEGGVPEYAKEVHTYTYGVYLLASYFYEHRGAIGDDSANLPLGVFSIANQLRFMPEPIPAGSDVLP